MGATAAAAQSGEMSGRKSGILVPQPHGGAIRQGGNTTPGSGRPRSSVKAIAKKSLRERLRLLDAFADGVAVSLETVTDAKGRESQKFVTHGVKVSERIKAIEVLAKVAGSDSVSMAEVRKRLVAQANVLRAMLPPDLADAAFVELEKVWR